MIQRSCRNDLHRALEDLLNAAERDGTRHSHAEFWNFICKLAHHCEIDKSIHEHGLEAVKKVPQSPKSTFEERKARAYAISIAARVVYDVGETSITPENFMHCVVVSDLLNMLDASSGEGSGTPQVLYSKRQGNGALRKSARRVIVGHVVWTNNATNKTVADIWFELTGEPEEKKFYKWQMEFGGAQGDLSRKAAAAGRANEDSDIYAYWGDNASELGRLVDLALGK